MRGGAKQEGRGDQGTGRRDLPLPTGGEKRGKNTFIRGSILSSFLFFFYFLPSLPSFFPSSYFPFFGGRHDLLHLVPLFSDVWSNKRNQPPSWTDRILVRSLPGLEPLACLTRYEVPTNTPHRTTGNCNQAVHESAYLCSSLIVLPLSPSLTCLCVCLACAFPPGTDRAATRCSAATTGL